MIATATDASGRTAATELERARSAGSGGAPIVRVRNGAVGNHHAGNDVSHIDLKGSTRLVMMLTPDPAPDFLSQARQLLSRLESELYRRTGTFQPTVLTVFLRSHSNRATLEALFAERFGKVPPLVTYVLEAPCNGAALALEAWAVGGEGVQVEKPGPHTLAVSYDGVRWVYCAGVEAVTGEGVHAQTISALKAAEAELIQAGARFDQVTRTWFFLGDITDQERKTQRYKELNRARTVYYHDVAFGSHLPGFEQPFFPASTGIGMRGRKLAVSCLAFQTARKDVRLFALENPVQAPAYTYDRRYSPQSPKFSRAIALRLGNYVTTWISGTASIVQSESVHLGDIDRQTEQTLDNIERLIAPENFRAHGEPGAGARCHDLAKVRVYIKRLQDYARCRAVCEKRLPNVPAIYVLADVCRPELLVEIEGVAFSRVESPPVKNARSAAPVAI